MLSVILVLIGSTRLLLTASVKTEHRLLLQAAFASLVVLVLHGLVDDIFYGSHSAFLLFSLPGIACTVSRPWPDRASKPSRAVSISLVAILAVLLLLFLLKWPVLSAAWQADLGAVQMAKIELKHFPTGSWDEQATIQDLAPVEITFQEALRRDPGQRTALMRLGRIAMERRDFSAAVSYLARARQIDPAHPGIVKSLAFSYAWNGQFDQAALLLQQVPGARQELEAYAWWWKEHGREDLAAKALEMLGRLEN